MEIKNIEKLVRFLGRALLAKAGYSIIKTRSLNDLKRKSVEGVAYQLFEANNQPLMLKRRDLISKSRSQILQDLFVLAQLQFKEKGYFVEFGATDGASLSNTWLLEHYFGWTGIVAEPAKTWHSILKENRNCIVDTRCVWSSSGETLAFCEARGAELSTLSSFVDGDHHRAARKNSKEYLVETVSLLDLLKCHNAPAIIDYLSIDTEGSEFEILEHFDFSKFRFRVITCEHNYTENRTAIFNLLSQHGYRRVFSEFSLFEDWYVSLDLLP